MQIPFFSKKRRRGRAKGFTTKAKSRLRWLGGILFVLSDVLIVLFILIPMPLGGRWIMVLSGSMEPALNVGGLVLVLPVDPASIEVGDILVHRPPNNATIMVAHRVTEVIEGPSPGFHTKGDANEEADMYETPAENVVGLVRFHVPRLAYMINSVADFGKTPIGMFSLMGIPGGIILIGELRNILSARNPRKAREKKLAERMKKRRKNLPKAYRNVAG